ncbi:hypothetical protein, partial [Frankia casuarinae]
LDGARARLAAATPLS